MQLDSHLLSARNGWRAVCWQAEKCRSRYRWSLILWCESGTFFLHHSYLHSPLDTWFQRARFRQEVNCVSRTVYTLSDPRLRRIQSIRTSSAVRNGNACNYEQTYATNVEYLDQVAFHGPSRYNLCTGIRLTVHTPSAASGHHRQMNLIITFKFEKLVLHFILCRFIFMWLSHGLVSKHLPISHSSESIDTTTKNPVYAGLRVWL